MSAKLVKNVFHWDHFCCYLGGPIDFVGDRGSNWRDEWTQELIEIGFAPESIFNPCKKPLPKGQFEFDLDNEAELMRKYREAHNYDKLCEIMAGIGHVDLRLVDHSDLVLVNMPKYQQSMVQNLVETFESASEIVEIALDDGIYSAYIDQLDEMRNAFRSLLTKYISTRIPTYGTIHEIVSATTRHVPVMMVWEGGKETCSAWLMWLIGHENVFSTFTDLKAQLVAISQGEKAYNAKDWLLFDFGKNRVYNERKGG